MGPGIGIGTEWTFAKFVEHMSQHEPKFSEDKFWKDLTKIGQVVASKLTSSPKVLKGFKNEAKLTHHFEVYGLDILMDENCELAMTEADTQPGLDWTDPVMPDGKFNEETE